jgi:1,4-dihydroxy-2-naphthoate octaprenyltransferase
MGYLGLGDLFAFAFFGPVAVVATAYVQTLGWIPEALFASLPIGFLITAILVVNNYRDVDTDRASGKRTLAVRLGRKVARAEWIALVSGAFLAAPVHWWLRRQAGPAETGDAWLLLPLLALPLALPPLRKLLRHRDGPTLNRALAETARLLLVYGALYALGIAL